MTGNVRIESTSSGLMRTDIPES